MNKLVALVAIAGVLLAGCATMLQGVTQEVKLVPYPGETEITVVDGDGATVYHGRAPTTVTLHRGGSYKMTVTKPGYEPATVELETDGVYSWLVPIWNWFFWVDLLTGAYREYDLEGIEVTLFRPGKRPPNAPRTSLDDETTPRLAGESAEDGYVVAVKMRGPDGQVQLAQVPLRPLAAATAE